MHLGAVLFLCLQVWEKAFTEQTFPLSIPVENFPLCIPARCGKLSLEVRFSMGENVRTLLEAAGGLYVSGQAMSERLGISRSAVWKQVKRLQAQGYEIKAGTNLGYRLVSTPQLLSREAIVSLLSGHPWQEKITVLETVDSTNDLAKRQALQGAPDGAIYLAEEQTGGRGRLGRSFVSPHGCGLYLSLLLRPDCAPAALPHVTAMAGVAACDAVEALSGVRPGIKWTNDLILEGKKVAGILTELSAQWESGTLESLVIGIGINCNHRETDFPEELRDKAASIAMMTGERIDRNLLAARLISRLYDLSQGLLQDKARWMAQYARDCITLGRQVQVLRGGSVRLGTATGLDENGGLLVTYENGEQGVVFSGEVSVRSDQGYI